MEVRPSLRPSALCGDLLLQILLQTYLIRGERKGPLFVLFLLLPLSAKGSLRKRRNEFSPSHFSRFPHFSDTNFSLVCILGRGEEEGGGDRRYLYFRSLFPTFFSPERFRFG